MESYSLFDTAGAFTLTFENGNDVLDLIASVGADLPFAETEPEIPAPPVVNYRETEDINLQVNSPYTVVLHKLSGKAVIAKPMDLYAASALIRYQHGDNPKDIYPAFAAKLPPADQVEVKDPASDARLLFRMEDAIAETFEQSDVYKTVQAFGFNIVVAPSLANWIKKEYRRRQREQTYFELPEVLDNRPIYQRLEVGVIVKCKKNTFNDSFLDGQRYMVTRMKDANLDEGTEPGVILQQFCGDYTGGVEMEWNSVDADLMSEHFEMDAESSGIYLPEQCIPAKYPELVAANRKKIEKAGLDLFKHTKFDASQAAVKSCYYAGKPMRMGKAQPLDALLLGPAGNRQMGDIKVGDLVFGSDGKPKPVTAIYPQGRKNVVRVVFSDGTSTECCEEHLWEVSQPWRKHDGLPGKVVEIGQIADDLFDAAGNAKYFIPIVKPLEFPEQELPLDPYALGALLGDGRLGTGKNGYGTPSFSSDDQELVEAVEQALPEGMKATHRTACDYELTTPGGTGTKRNPLIVILEQLNLRHRAEAKFIPKMYKHSSIEQRRRLLSGLLDTDGGSWEQANENSATVVEFTSISEHLVNDVLFLVQSLGGIATKSSRIPSYTHNGEKRKGQRAYRLRIKFAPGWNPFTLKRKAVKFKPCTKFLPTRSIVAVEPVGTKPCQCITVDSSDGLYLTNDCILTHNTREALTYLWLRGHKRNVYMAPSNAIPFAEKDLKALKLTNYKVIRSFEDLAARGEQPWLEIVPHSWAKGKQDPHDHDQIYGFERETDCPHCNEKLVRRAVITLASKPEWTTEYGYLCRNPGCTYQEKLAPQRFLKGSKESGAAWHSGATRTNAKTVTHHLEIAKTIRVAVMNDDYKLEDRLVRHETEKRAGSGYVDLERKLHAAHHPPAGVSAAKAEASKDRFHGRECIGCGYVDKTWQPPRYRRIMKRYRGGGFDEIHLIKSPNTDVTQAANAIKVRSRVGMTGTLMPNNPTDAYWPLFWMFGNGTAQFPYPKRAPNLYQGVTRFNSDFTETVQITNVDKGTSYRKRIPYLKNPIKFWNFMGPKMIRRSYDDPLVEESLIAAGLVRPAEDRKIILAKPDPKQAALYTAATQEFQKQFQEYIAELEAKGVEAGKIMHLNQTKVLPKMMRMRIAATCPDYFNEKLKAKGIDIPLYKGVRGGGKMEEVYNIVLSKCAKGEKVVVLSNFRSMQKALAEELDLFHPILFDTGWDWDERMEAFNTFEQDPNRKVFIAGPLAIGLGVDLSKASTCICTDLLWRPGEQQQAWSRILTPTKEPRTCEIYLVLLEHSIDVHIHNVFYSKLFAAEQALDRRVITKKEKSFDVKSFVEQVLSDRKNMYEYMLKAGEEELAYMPIFEMFQMEDRAV